MSLTATDAQSGVRYAGAEVKGSDGADAYAGLTLTQDTAVAGTWTGTLRIRPCSDDAEPIVTGKWTVEVDLSDGVYNYSDYDSDALTAKKLSASITVTGSGTP